MWDLRHLCTGYLDQRLVQSADGSDSAGMVWKVPVLEAGRFFLVSQYILVQRISVIDNFFRGYLHRTGFPADHHMVVLSLFMCQCQLMASYLAKALGQIDSIFVIYPVCYFDPRIENTRKNIECFQYWYWTIYAINNGKIISIA